MTYCRGKVNREEKKTKEVDKMTWKQLIEVLANRGKTMLAEKRTKQKRETSRQQLLQLGSHLLQDLGLNEKGWLPRNAGKRKIQSVVPIGIPTNSANPEKICCMDCCPADVMAGTQV
jgi:uncharacterized protein YjiS (DUF1127 family)